MANTFYPFPYRWEFCGVLGFVSLLYTMNFLKSLTVWSNNSVSYPIWVLVIITAFGRVYKNPHIPTPNHLHIISSQRKKIPQHSLEIKIYFKKAIYSQFLIFSSNASLKLLLFWWYAILQILPWKVHQNPNLVSMADSHYITITITEVIFFAHCSSNFADWSLLLIYL